MITVTLKTLKKLLPYFWEHKLPLYLWGKPSTGKSSAIRQFAEEKARELKLKFTEDKWGKEFFTFQVTYLSQMDAPDLIGLPMRGKDEHGNEVTKYVPADIIPRQGQGIWVLEEANHADVTIRSAANQFVLDRRYHNIVLPNGVWVMAASNTAKDYCEVNVTPLNIASRFTHLHIEMAVEEFLMYGLESNFDSRILGYLKNFPDDLFPKVFDERMLDKKANPFPRQWENASHLISGTKAAGANDPVYGTLNYLVAACIGPEVATRFLAWVKMTDRLDIPKLISKPEENIKKIKESSQKASLFWAVVSTLSSFWFNKNKKLTAKKVVEISTLLPPEFSVAFLKMILKKRTKELTVLNEFEKLLNKLGIYFDEV